MLVGKTELLLIEECGFAAPQCGKAAFPAADLLIVEAVPQFLEAGGAASKAIGEMCR